MDNQIINQRLQDYATQTTEDKEHALKEILQGIALYSLSTSDFFKQAMFQGGTALRILYGLPRFSEDLDFILTTPNNDFKWQNYIQKIQDSFALYGIKPELQDRSQANTAVQKLFLKDNSIGKILNSNFSHHGHRKLTIKFEIDTNPPAGSTDEMHFLDFPIDYSVITQDLTSNFASKCHALLCRPYIKGRDWFDFLWYLRRNIKPNLNFLQNALQQCGPWQDKKLTLDKQWLNDAFSKKIAMIDWKKAAADVAPFLATEQQQSLSFWSKTFFQTKLKKLISTMQ